MARPSDGVIEIWTIRKIINNIMVSLKLLPRPELSESRLRLVKRIQKKEDNLVTCERCNDRVLFVTSNSSDASKY